MGSVEVGKWADLMLWRPAFFGVKPSLILKGGFIAAALMGDANANIPTPQAVQDRRSVKQGDMVQNGSLPRMEIDAQTCRVRRRWATADL